MIEPESTPSDCIKSPSTDTENNEESERPAAEASPAVTCTDKPESSKKDRASSRAHNPNPPSDVVELCKETFQKTAEYLQGELDGTIEDYKLLEKMNKVTMNKYSEMKHIALSISGALNDLNDKYQRLNPYLQQIDQVEESVADLEKAAYSLDQYSKRLEAKFKALEKR